MLKFIALGVWIEIKPIRDVFVWRIGRVVHTIRATLFSCDEASSPVSGVAGSSTYTMHSLSAYLDARNLVTYELAPPETTKLYMPDVCPTQYQQCFHSGGWSLKAPAIIAIEVPDAEVIGGSDFIFAEQQCLHHGLYQFERDLTVEEVNGIIAIKAKKKGGLPLY